MDKNLLNPEISLTAKCHTCQEVITYGLEKCPYCGIRLDQEEMTISAFNCFAINQAITSANTIRTFDPAAPIFLAVILLRVLIDIPSWYEFISSVFWLFPVLVIAGWFQQHGKWISKDEEYLSAQKAMKSSFQVWMAVNILSLIVFSFSDGWVK
ncbi:MAG: hypothetical protein M3X11_25295 [Acidobacteriota bacterium]|nr:hypothetical protein [Acidobacteriota bacterium]